MSKQLMDVVLPRLQKPLWRQLRRYRAGKLDDAGFTQEFETLLRQQHDWLASRGVSEVRAALAIHGAVLVLSGDGLRKEADEVGVPLEVIEIRAIREAAADIARHYHIKDSKAVRIISRIVARYGR